MHRIINALASDADTASMRLPVPITVASPRPAISSSTCQRDIHIVLLISAQRAADRIEQEALGLIDGLLRELLVTQPGSPARHRGSDSFLGSSWSFRRERIGHELSYFEFCFELYFEATIKFFGFLNGKNAMKSAWCTM